MPQVDYNIANAPGATVRSDLIDHFEAVVQLNSGIIAPSTTFAHMLWADTSSSPSLIKIRNAGDSAFKGLFTSNGQLRTEAGTNSIPSHSFNGDTNTGASNPSGDIYVISTGGSERLRLTNAESVFNEVSGDVDFRIESNTNSHMFFIDAGNDRIGINQNTPTSIFHISNTTTPHLKIELVDNTIAVDDILGKFSFVAGESNIENVCEIRGVADIVDWGMTSSPSRFEFHITRIGSTTQTEMFRISSTGIIVNIDDISTADFRVNTNLFFCDAGNNNIGIGTTSINTSAKLEVDSTTGAILFPRMTTTQRNALTATNGMQIYNTTDNQMQGYINGAWTAM